MRDGKQVDSEELREHLAQDYAKWQIPDRFEFIDEIPRTATGKFKKTTLRERYVDAKVQAARHGRTALRRPAQAHRPIG